MPPTAENVKAQLDRIVSSERFSNAERMSGFLRYVVDRALAGEAEQIKEYVIGVEVFGRDTSFDPRLDSIVRVEARRLRSKIDEYYAGPGAADPVLIQLRRGSYVPAFELRAAASALQSTDPNALPEAQRPGSPISWRVGLALGFVLVVSALAAATRHGQWLTGNLPAPETAIAVLPFSEYDADPDSRLLAARLTDGVTAELARTGAVAVAAHTSVLKFSESPRRSIREIAQAVDADIVLEGSLLDRIGDQVKVSIRLVNPQTERKIWVEDFVGDVRDLGNLERRIAAATVPAATRESR